MSRPTRQSKRKAEEVVEETEVSEVESEPETGSESEHEVKEEKKTRGRKKKEVEEPPKKKQKKEEKEATPKLTLDYNASGVALSFGQGDMGQLGHGSDPAVLERKRPAFIKALEGKKIVNISSGSLHNAVLTDEGEVLIWGCNDDNALGRGTIQEGDEYLAAPIKFHDNKKHKIVSVACGASHTLVLDEDGQVWVSGSYRDQQGLLGFDEKNDSVNVFTKLPFFSTSSTTFNPRTHRCIGIAAGDNHSLILVQNKSTKSTHVYWMGDICFGQRMSDRKKKQRKLVPSLVLIKKSGRAAHIVSVFAGGNSSFAVDQEGRVYGWGPNNYGQCGFDTKGGKANMVIHAPTVIPFPEDVKIAQVAAAQHHTLFLSQDGKVYSCGRGQYGRLGLGGEETKEVPTLVPSESFKNLTGEALTASSKAVHVGVGEAHSLVVMEDGRAFSCGSGDLNQLGLGEEEDVHVFTQINGQQLQNRLVLKATAGSQHSMLLARDNPSSASLSSSSQ